MADARCWFGKNHVMLVKDKKHVYYQCMIVSVLGCLEVITTVNDTVTLSMLGHNVISLGIFHGQLRLFDCKEGIY